MVKRIGRRKIRQNWSRAVALQQLLRAVMLIGYTVTFDNLHLHLTIFCVVFRTMKLFEIVLFFRKSLSSWYSEQLRVAFVHGPCGSADDFFAVEN